MGGRDWDGLADRWAKRTLMDAGARTERDSLLASVGSAVPGTLQVRRDPCGLLRSRHSHSAGRDAGCRNRTRGIVITNHALYQLS